MQSYLADDDLDRGGGVVPGEFLGRGSGEGAVERVAVGEGLPIGVDVGNLTVAGEGHVGGVAL